MLVAVDGQRYTYLRRGDEVDGCLVVLENLEHLTQEAVGQKHAARLDANRGNAILGGDGLDLVQFGLVAHQRTRSLRVHRIQQTHGDVVHTCWSDAGGVQDLGTEIGKLGSLVKVELAHRLGVSHHARVVVVHTVDVGPDLNLFGTDSGTDDRS